VRAGELIAGRYLLEAEVAMGGGGRVFRAHHVADGQLVAVKLMVHLAGEGAARFKRESLLLARVSHPALLRYHAHGVADDGTPWLATEWLTGEDLRRRLSRRAQACTLAAEQPTRIVPAQLDADPVRDALDDAPLSLGPVGVALSWQEVVTLLFRLAAALGTLHAEGLVHRDVKPSNVFLVDGLVTQAKLIDLGAARGVAAPGDLTKSGYLVGTPMYMAPEQARGAAHITSAADVWSLGCVAYECLRGQPPFRGVDLADTLARIQHDEPLSLFGLGLGAPDLLLGLVHRMLRKEPRERPADGGALIAELEVLGDVSLPRSSSAVDTSLGESEKRVGCLLSAEPRQEGASHATAHEAFIEAGLGSPTRSGSRWIARLPTSETMTDQAHRAARVALRLRDSLPGWTFAVTSGLYSDTEHALDAPAALLARAAAGEVVIDARTASLLENRYAMEGSTGVYRLAHALEAETARTLLGRPTRTVGRRRELAMLDATWAACIDEPRARVLLLTAGAGVGKSRVRWEFARSLRSRREPHLLLSLQGDSMSAGSPFSMIAPALQRAATLVPGESLELRRSKLRAMVHRAMGDEPAAARVAAFLGELAGVPFDDSSDEALRAARADPMLLSEQLREAFVTWLSAEVRRHPILVVVDDLQWGDRTSVALIDAALRALQESPVMVLALGRPEVHDVFPGLWSSHSQDELRLEPLGKKASAELAREVLGRDGIRREGIELEVRQAELTAVAERAQGNALYLEELLRAMVQDGVAPATALPPTVVGMVQSRMESMGPEARRVLRAASVFGEAFWEGGVRYLVGDAGASFGLAEWLDDLVRRELVSQVAESVFPGEVEYRFRHSIVRDSAYALLTDDDRAKAHRLAGQWLEWRGERDAHVLASHFDRGGAASDAVRCYARAAELALEGNDLDSALRSTERARACGAEGPGLGALHALSASAFFWQSRYPEAASEGLAALDLCAPGTNQWFQACGVAVVALARLGDVRAFDEAFARLAQASPAEGAATAHVVALSRGAFQLVFKGRLADADSILQRIGEVALAAPRLDAIARAQASHVRGARAAIVGDVALYLHHLEDAVAAFEEAGDMRNVALERSTVGWCHAELGRFDEAIERIRANLDWCRSLRSAQAVTYAKLNLGFALERGSSSPDEADRLLRSAAAEAAEVKNLRLEGWARGHLASLWLRHGQPSIAEHEARRACSLLRHAPNLYGWALGLWARAMLRLGRPRIAHDAAAEAVRLLEQVGGLLQGSALPRLVLAEVLAERGTLAEAIEVLQVACDHLLRHAAALTHPDARAAFLALPEHADTFALRERVRARLAGPGGTNAPSEAGDACG
jgi:serine/threonine protein kinase/tetratricopeptide (TPR) repeat protein